MTRRAQIFLALFLVAGVLTCRSGSRSPWASSRPRETGDYAATVTAKYDCFGVEWNDPRCRPYQRPDDPQGQFIRLLFSYDYACVVSQEDMIMAQINARYTCRWRAPR